MPALDNYDQDDIDDEGLDESVSYEEQQNARLRAEQELDRRDAREDPTGRRQRLPGALEGKPSILTKTFQNDRCTFLKRYLDPQATVSLGWQ